jgi:hypothetical protein
LVALAHSGLLSVQHVDTGGSEASRLWVVGGRRKVVHQEARIEGWSPCHPSVLGATQRQTTDSFERS